MTFDLARVSDPLYFAENRMKAHSDHRWFASAGEAARAEALAKRWLAHFHDYDEAAWAPDATGSRIQMAKASGAIL